ncbi:MAG: hypothetical protein J6B04_01285 [Clostridia bacterium]|nr:hypothetical protein [Clostridia bacterium]
MSKKFKKNTKTALIWILVGVLVIASLAVIIALTRTNTEDERVEIKPAFAIGGLDDAGKYVDTDKTLYTKDAFACEGLEVKLNFDATISYQVFYYNEDEEFISASETLTATHTATLPEGAEYARLVVSPDWTGVEVEDQEITTLSKTKYTSQLKILVANENYVNTKTFTLFTYNDGMSTAVDSAEIVPINYDEYKLEIYDKEQSNYSDHLDGSLGSGDIFILTFYDEDFNVIARGNIENGEITSIENYKFCITFSIEEKATYFDSKIDVSKIEYLAIVSTEDTCGAEITLTAVESE